MNLLIILISGLFGLVTVIYFWLKHYFNYWEQNNILHIKSKSLYRYIFPDKSLHLRLRESYEKFHGKSPCAGFFLYFQKTFLLFDLDLIKNVLIKDFNNFADRGVFSNEKYDPVSVNLGSANEQKWRFFRSNLSPALTLNKLKFTFPLLLDVAEKYVIGIKKLQQTQKNSEKAECITDINEIMICYAIDVFLVCFLGVDSYNFGNPNSEFCHIGKLMFHQPRHNELILSIMRLFPNIFQKLRIKLVHSEVSKFLSNFVRQMIELRERENIKRNDFMNYLIELKNGSDENSFTIDEITAQIYSFFLGSFESSSGTLTFCLYHLASDHDIQDKARAEINEVLKNNCNLFTYEILNKFTYLKQLMQETLRLHPILPRLIRKSLNDYSIPHTNIIIPKNSAIMIPIESIQRDPAIYLNPEKFDPDRFLPTEIQKRHSCSWLPFGQGPRNCIGAKFGEMQIIVVLAVLLKNFKFLTCDKTQNNLGVSHFKNFTELLGGLKLKIEKI